MKVVPSFPNKEDNVHCLQACVRGVLTKYFPGRNFSDEEIDKKTGQIGGWSWLPPAVCWLNELKLKVILHNDSNKFDYKSFASDGIGYLNKVWSPERINMEMVAGAFGNLDFVHEQTQKMINRNLYNGKPLSLGSLSKFLANDNNLVVAKTGYNLLSGDTNPGNSHYVLVIDKPEDGKWRINDPGLPEIANRIVNSKIAGNSIFGDMVLIKGDLSYYSKRL